MERGVSGDDDDNAGNLDQWSKWCEAYKLPQPMQIEEFNRIDWNHVSKYESTCLEVGSNFLSKGEKCVVQVLSMASMSSTSIPSY